MSNVIVYEKDITYLILIWDKDFFIVWLEKFSLIECIKLLLVWQTTQTLPLLFFSSLKKNILIFLHFLYHINHFLLLFK
jgi:hypothetical protein